MTRSRQILLCLVAAMCLATGNQAEATFITVENLGGSPLTMVDLRFVINPATTPVQIDVQIVSPGDDPIGVGQTFTSPLIPQITDVSFAWQGFFINQVDFLNGFGGNPLINPVIPDVSSFGVIFNPPIDLAFSLSFFSGGEPAPVPEPSTLLLLGSGLAGLGGAAGRRHRRK
jgi:hypothetical protein